MKEVFKYALCIEYDGTNFNGWQKQRNSTIRSVESTLETAITYISNHPIKIVGAGRTDTGVHAMNQIAHFETTSQRSDYSWLMGINSNLPDDCAVKSIQRVSPDFHARFNAISRIYKYHIHANPYRSPLTRLHQTWVRYPLNVEKMREAATMLIGEHDFSAFRSSECQSKSTHRTIHYITIKRDKDLIEVEIKANAFLHHMVRNIVGTLLEVGKEKELPAYVKTVLESKDRTNGGMTAPPQGLYLYQVNYPDPIFIV